MEENTVRIYYIEEIGEGLNKKHIEEWSSREDALNFITANNHLLLKIEAI